MPKYGKFLKDLLSNKKKLGGISEVSLSEQCSTVVQNKLPEKMVDSGRFVIRCLFGGLHLNQALADLGANINLMSYSVYKQLDLGELQPTRMSIFLADRSVKYPRGVVENLLVKVSKFVFPVGFVILDMEVDDRVPLILGRPFLRTAKAMTDVFDGKLTLRVGDSDPMLEVGEPAPNLEEPSYWAVELERLLDEQDEYSNEVPNDLLEMMAEFDELIGKTPSANPKCGDGFALDSVREIIGNEVPCIFTFVFMLGTALAVREAPITFLSRYAEDKGWGRLKNCLLAVLSFCPYSISIRAGSIITYMKFVKATRQHDRETGLGRAVTVKCESHRLIDMLGARMNYKLIREETENEAGSSKEENGKFMPLAVRGRGEEMSRGTRGTSKPVATKLSLAVIVCDGDEWQRRSRRGERSEQAITETRRTMETDGDDDSGGHDSVSGGAWFRRRETDGIKCMAFRDGFDRLAGHDGDDRTVVDVGNGGPRVDACNTVVNPVRVFPFVHGLHASGKPDMRTFGIRAWTDKYTYLVGELQCSKVKLENEDILKNFIRSLPSCWTLYTVSIRRTENLKTLPMTELFCMLKTFELEIIQAKERNSSHQSASSTTSPALHSDHSDPSSSDYDPTRQAHQA
ncbi:hypothetical protein L1987_22687 [Smallanthus sonchifolius]|uniref:Uncharacterized protein n=1 Tax=Smallanthus sonchifolius TaxID=185202 RepID=A0ACB9II69_9ASTR|nr:hypothetical protein L1987_22687 [Smallanthus sonchifolius]